MPVKDNYNMEVKEPYSYFPGAPGYMSREHIAEVMNIHPTNVPIHDLGDPDRKIGPYATWSEETVMRYLQNRTHGATLTPAFAFRMVIYGYQPRYREKPASPQRKEDA